MLVKEVMNPKVVVAKPTATIKEAAKVMSELRIGGLVIMEGEKIVGIMTERDVMKNVVAQAKDPEMTKISDIMTKEVVTIEPDKELEDACSLMVEKDVKRLPVVDSGKLVGIITATDVISIQPKMIESLAKLLLFREKKAIAG